MDELLSEFLTETEESLAVVDVELVQLEQNPNNPDLLANIFRLVHTIKGTCGFLGLPRLEKVAHAAEDLLGLFRDGTMDVSPGAVTLILTALDRIKEILAVLAETEAEPDGDDSELIGQLRAMYDAALAGDTAAMDAATASPGAPAPAPEPAPAGEGDISDVQEAADIKAAVAAAETEDGKLLIDGQVVDKNADPEDWFQPVAAGDTGNLPAAAKPGEKKAEEPKKEAKPAAAAGGDGPKKDPGTQSIRVTVELLENLMNMVSELVLTRNQLMQMVRNQHDSEFAVPLQRLSHVTTELQEGVMKTRMQPIGNAWAKLPRIVRDLSLELGKKIELEMLGADTELDRQVLELIKDPLTHMVRNSADHGMEQPEDRKMLGKPETGKITLNAFQEGGHIIIEIKDDGKGIPVDVIRRKAIEKELTTEAEAVSLSDQQILQFIFKAGFSTAQQVTNVSGRGVGMDVVRTNIEKIGGTVELKSEEGKGTTFTIKIPLTLAIVSALIVESAGERFAIPQVSVIELVRASEDSEQRIETINETSVLRLRNRLLPLVSLRHALQLETFGGPGFEPTAGKAGSEAVDAAAEAIEAIEAAAEATSLSPEQTDGELFIVVTQVGTYKFGIVVDRVFDTEEIVVKPVAPLLRSIGMFSGNTILGDGSVIMILDPNGLAAATGEVAMGETGEDAEAIAREKRDSDKVALLVFRAGGTEPKAVPLSLVARLEEIDVAQIELSNKMRMVQYRGQLMPLVMANDDYELRSEGRQPVLVFADNERSMGLVVEEIVDIVEDRLDVEISSLREGLLGSAVVNGKATEVIDAGYFLNLAFGDWFKTHEDVPFGRDGRRRLLLVDDSPFFRNLLAPLLEVAGYQVIQCDSAADALKLHETHEDFDVIVSDIEMPGMNGFEFVETIRAGGHWAGLPVIALSSHATPADLERGREAGFTDYVAKFDREALLQSLSHSSTLNAAGEPE